LVCGGKPEEGKFDMALPEFSMRQLLEAGTHFGHQTHRWNPKMERYIFGSRANIHIIDLSQSIPLLHQALIKVREVAASGGRVLFVGTKRQASDPVATAAKRCAQYYVNHRWLGGTLTNWRTISGSIARLRELEGVLDGADTGRTKKELLQLTREREKLELSLGGIKDMGGIPDIMFVIDTNKEGIAIQEARKLNIPVIAILDTNCDPDGITFPIPGNDDAARALQLYCDLIADAVLDGLAAGQASSGVDLGASEAPMEPALQRELTPELAVAEEAPAEAVATEVAAD
jgi:small subunit ribosomal protein S2